MDAVGLVLTFVALVVLVLDGFRRRARVTTWAWNWISVYVFVAGLAIAAPLYAGKVAGGITTVETITGPITVTAGWVQQIASVAAGTLVVLSASVVIYSVRNGVRLNAIPLVLALTVAISAISDSMAGAEALPPRRIVLLAVLLTCATLRDAHGAREGAAAFVVFIGLSHSAAIFILGDGMFRTCRDDKCSAFGVMLTGLYGNENALALCLAAGIPFVFLAYRAASAWRISLSLLAILALTGSRTGLLAAVVTLLAWGGFRVLTVSVSNPRTAMLALRTGVLLLFGFAFAYPHYVVLTGAAGSGLTGRTDLWTIALDALRDAPAFGLGHAAWSAQTEVTGGISAASAYSVHNLFLDVTFAAGFVGTVLFVACMIGLVLKLGRIETGNALITLVPIAVIGISERPWSLDTIDWLTWSLVAVLCIASRDGDAAPLPARRIGSSNVYAPEGRHN